MTKLKPTKAFSKTLLAAVFLATAAVTAFAASQPEGRRGGRGGPHGRSEGPGMLFRDLDLSEQQREQIRSLFEQSGSQETMTRLSELQRSLNEAIETGADEGALRQLGSDLGIAQGDAAVERSRLHQATMQLLTPEQRQEYEELKAERKKRMEERRERFEQRRQRGRERDPDSF